MCKVGRLMKLEIRVRARREYHAVINRKPGAVEYQWWWIYEGSRRSPASWEGVMDNIVTVTVTRYIVTAPVGGAGDNGSQEASVKTPFKVSMPVRCSTKLCRSSL